MTNDVVIRAECLGKKYTIGHQRERERYVALRDVIASRAKRLVRSSFNFYNSGVSAPGCATEEFWALRDVNFDVRQGEVVGVIGRNGAGKSTLLKVLSRITEPSEGRVVIQGRVASLLEVGTGFHPELTGRENIFLNGAVLGMTRAEIRQKFDQIVSFAEVEKFLDTPVKRYSSGMYVRLAFAVAAHLEPEIIVVDEVLAVGDIEFQRKCLGKMSEIAGAGRTVLFVSHNMAAIQALCGRAIYLSAGAVAAKGATAEIISRYLENPTGQKGQGHTSCIRVQDGLLLEHLRCFPDVIRSADSMQIEVAFLAHVPGRIRECAILIYSARGVRVAIVDARDSETMPYDYTAGRTIIRAELKSLPLVEGVYALGLYLVTDRFSGDMFDLAHFTIGASRNHRYVPYQPDARGLITITAGVSVSTVQETMLTRDLRPRAKSSVVT